MFSIVPKDTMHKEWRRKMSKISGTTFSVLVFGSMLLGQERVTQTLPCKRYPGVRDYKSWLQSTGLPVGEFYRVSSKKKYPLLKAYARLELGMSRSQARKLLGTPDFEQLVPEAIMRVPTGTCQYQWAYILSKDEENMADRHDVAIYLSFSSKDGLIWAAPQNVDLVPKGSPTGK
jgi:hypothetical protein